MFPNIENLDATKKRGSTTPVTADSLPGILPGAPTGAWNPGDYRVRYLKLNMDELSDITELEMIETKAIRNQGVYLLSKKDFIFMDKLYMLISYLELDDPKKGDKPSFPQLTPEAAFLDSKPPF